MSSLAETLYCTQKRNPDGPRGFIGRLLLRLEARAVRRETLRSLSNLSDRELRDIGLDRAGVEEIASAAARQILERGDIAR